jgi:hypothetical protein
VTFLHSQVFYNAPGFMVCCPSAYCSQIANIVPVRQRTIILENRMRRHRRHIAKRQFYDRLVPVR